MLSPSDMKLRVYVPLAFLLLLDFAVSQFKCDFRMYGRPQIGDCASTFLAMPDSKEMKATAKLATLRRFVEPQFLDPPFSPLESDLASEMEQIPKFWRYSKDMNKKDVIALGL